LWSFPTEIFTQSINLRGPLENYNAPGWALLLWIIVLGTILPYLCVLAGIKILSASTSSVIGMLEPVIAGIFAWIWINETWNAIQLIGGATVIAGIYIADKTRTKVK
jgi:drug/metabolite transporter (DMT)-like permease